MKMALGVTEASRPPGTRHSSHMPTQKPPRVQPRPSVSSLKNMEAAPKAQPDTTTATTYPPWIALLTGTFMT